MSFTKSKNFKYAKNFIIGVGASLVMLGALWKIQSWEMPNIGGITVDMLTVGLIVEAILFFALGILGPEKDYYWDKLYPGLDDYSASIKPLANLGPAADDVPALNGEVVEQQLGGMLTELQGMSRSLGSLKALQDADFSGTSEQVKAMSNYYSKMNEAMADLADSVEDAKAYKTQLGELNKNIASLNNSYNSLNTVYGNVIGAMRGTNQ